MNLLVVDDTTLQPLIGANVSGQASTSCCSGCWVGCSCNSCDSGAGYPVSTNTDSSGYARWDETYSCGQNFALTITAVGYHNTSVELQRGETNTDDYFDTSNGKYVSMTPLQNVPQSNQGAGGTTTGATQQTTVQTTSFLAGNTLLVVVLGLLFIAGLGVFLVYR